MPYTTQITLYGGMPFDAAYKNTLYPTSVSNKKAWMDRQSECPKKVITSLMQFKIDTNTGFGYMRLPVADVDSNKFNYAHIQHKGVAFFAFILGCEYINDGKDGESVYQYKFKKDVMMSHFVSELQLKPAPITRHHSTMQFRNPYYPEPFGGRIICNMSLSTAPDWYNLTQVAGYRQWATIVKLAMCGVWKKRESKADPSDPDKTITNDYNKEIYDSRWTSNTVHGFHCGTFLQGSFDPCISLVCWDKTDIEELVTRVLEQGNMKIVDMYVVPTWAVKAGITNGKYKPFNYGDQAEPYKSLFPNDIPDTTMQTQIDVLDDQQKNAYQLVNVLHHGNASEFLGEEFVKLKMYPYAYYELTAEGQSIKIKPEEWKWVPNPESLGGYVRQIGVFCSLQNPVSIDYWPLNVVWKYTEHSGSHATPTAGNIDMYIPSGAMSADGSTSGSSTPADEKVPLDSYLGHITVSNFPTCAWLESPYAQAVGQGKIVNIDAIQKAWDAGNATYTGPANGIAGEYQQLKTTLGAKLSSVANDRASMSSIAKYTAMTGMPNMISAATSSGGNPITFAANMIDNQTQLYKTAVAAKMTPPTVGGGAGGGSASFARNNFMPVLRKYELSGIDTDALQTIFRKYGYAQGGVVQKPDISGRERYCYVETAGDVFVPTLFSTAGFDGMCNANECAEINAAFMDGVMFWNPDHRLNDVVSNTSTLDSNGILNVGRAYTNPPTNPSVEGMKDPCQTLVPY